MSGSKPKSGRVYTWEERQYYRRLDQIKKRQAKAQEEDPQTEINNWNLKNEKN